MTRIVERLSASLEGRYRIERELGQGQAEEARALMRQTLSLDPNGVNGNYIYQWVLALVGTREEAAAQAQKNLSISDLPMRRGMASWSLARGGKPSEAASIRRSLEALPVDTPGRSTGLAFARLGVEDWPGALTAIEDAANREPELILALLMLSPPYDPIRSDPRFAAVIRQLNLDVDLFTRPDGGRSSQAKR